MLHFYWLRKSDVREPLMYAGIWAVLMLYRVKLWMGTAKTGKPAPVAA